MSTPPRSHHKRHRQSGFTLAELMVVIVITPLITTFIFYLLSESSRVSGVIQELNDAQTTLQFAVGSIERDLRRAGYMSLTTVADKRLCVSYPSNDFNAIRYITPDTTFNAAITALPPPGALNTQIQPDAIELFGNFTTTADFPAYIDPSNTGSLRINFSGTEIDSAAAFERAFGSPNQLVMVTGQTGQLQIVQLNIVGSATSLYNVATGTAILPIRTGGASLGFNTTSACGVAIRFRVAPLHKVRYRINVQTANDWQLIREVLNPGNCTATGSCSGGNWQPYADTTPHPPLIIAPNAVDLQFWFTSWTGSTPTNWDPLCRGDKMTDCVSNNTVATHDDALNHWPSDPATVRSVFYRVSVRSRTEDATLRHTPRPNLQSTILTYDIDGTLNGSARVRSIVKNVMIPNMLAR